MTNKFTHWILAGVLVWFVSGSVLGQEYSPIDCWSPVVDASRKTKDHSLRISPDKYALVRLDTLAMKSALKKAPLEFSQASKQKNNQLVISLPTPDGKKMNYRLEYVATMAPELAEKYPTIKTYGGQGIEDPTAAIKVDFTELGFHAMVMSNVHGQFFIDPAFKGDFENYIVYYKHDLKKNGNFTDQVLGTLNPNETGGMGTNLPKPPAAKCIGQQLRTYRAAVACTGEYAVAATGVSNPTLAQTLSAIVTSVNRVTGIYEKEVSIRLQLIATNDKVVFTNANTDPFKGNNNANTLIAESQKVIDSLITNANYDIGHTFSTGGGGLAQLGCVCQKGNKGSGITGSSSPVGDAYDVDYVAHEMGHQFGGEHTFGNNTTGSCGGNASSNANSEPGSGSTIMAYAGICTATNDLQQHSDPIFNAISFDQIVNYSNLSNGNSCAVITQTGNNPPIVNAGKDYSIPYGTPFTLTGSATDPDGDAVTYCWEQTNTGGPFGNWNAPTGDAPIFRSFSPVTVPYRTFPRMTDVVANKTTIGEIMASYARTLEFRLTARDNKNNGGGVCYDVMNVNVIKTSAPFAVTYPNTAVVWNVGEYRNVTWNVVGTDLSPIKCQSVAIELSTDGGLTYPVVLIDSTDNDGSEAVLVPNKISKTVRVRVRALGNIFFDISNANFTIQAPKAATYSLNYPALSTTCAGNDASFKILVSALGNFTKTVAFSASGLPGSTVFNISKNNFVPTDSAIITINNTAGLATGTYSFNLTAVGDTSTQTRTLTFNIISLAGFTSTALVPAPNSIGAVLQPTFTWSFNPLAVSTEFYLATDSLFNNIVYSNAAVNDSFLVLPVQLNVASEYYWKVRPTAKYCGGAAGVFSKFNRFKTGFNTCFSLKNSTVSTISANGAPTVTSRITVPVDSIGVITKVSVVNLNITHAFFSDLKTTLSSPKGTSVVLFNSVCDSAQSMNFGLDDDALISVLPCPATNGLLVKPASPLSAFNGESALGVWSLKVQDQFSGSGGKLNSWGLQICRMATIPLPIGWLSFTAQKGENKNVFLSWRTFSEKGNLRYVVERSRSANEGFVELATVNGSGKPNSVEDFYFNDGWEKTGSVFYRIKEVGADGSISYSKVLMVDFNEAVELNVYPNPAHTFTQVTSKQRIMELSLYGTNGRKMAGAMPRAYTFKLPLSGLSKGTYILKVVTEGKTIVRKITLE